ncbi:MAG: hypothetical protein DWQ04_12595 [Chloroflexi bacterium]|nr:MAG: hypothetical protein DWQ04_12595 [Chloroflexota bacterium]
MINRGLIVAVCFALLGLIACGDNNISIRDYPDAADEETILQIDTINFGSPAEVHLLITSDNTSSHIPLVNTILNHNPDFISIQVFEDEQLISTNWPDLTFNSENQYLYFSKIDGNGAIITVNPIDPLPITGPIGGCSIIGVDSERIGELSTNDHTKIFSYRDRELLMEKEDFVDLFLDENKFLAELAYSIIDKNAANCNPVEGSGCPDVTGGPGC